ncbi:MAG: hypothetical protein GTN59_04345 [Candidatus Dadabacteria bacterium]|nr:hypothetical protein [Candidatus Dadabacteria bacterium]
MSEKKIFSDFESAIEFIIDSLDDSERDLIKNADPAGLYMALDRWIKNDYVYSETTNINELIHEKVREEDPYYNNNPSANLTIHPDNLSGIIIEGLIEKLQN